MEEEDFTMIFLPEVPEIPILIFLGRERERETEIVGICVYR